MTAVVLRSVGIIPCQCTLHTSSSISALILSCTTHSNTAGGDDYCYACFKAFHSKGNGRKKHKKKKSRHSWIGFQVGTSVHICTECAPEKVTVASQFCKDCEDYFCNSCFATLHERGSVKSHRQRTLCTDPGPPPAPLVDLDVDAEESLVPLVVKRTKSAAHDARAAKLALSRRIRSAAVKGNKDAAEIKKDGLENAASTVDLDLESSCTNLGSGMAQTVGIVMLTPANTGGLPIDTFRVYLRECEDSDEDISQYYPRKVAAAKEQASGSITRIKLAGELSERKQRVVLAWSTLVARLGARARTRVCRSGGHMDGGMGWNRDDERWIYVSCL